MGKIHALLALGLAAQACEADPVQGVQDTPTVVETDVLDTEAPAGE